MSDFRRKLFEWLDPDWLEEAGRFPVPGHGGDDRVHDGGDHDHHGAGHGDHGAGDHDRVIMVMVTVLVEDDKKVDEVNYLHCALRCGWLGGKPQSADRLSYCSLAGSTFNYKSWYTYFVWSRLSSSFDRFSCLAGSAFIYIVPVCHC